MSIVKVSVCQYKSVPLDNFKQFKSRVNTMFEEVDNDAHYVVFPELFNVGLYHSFMQNGTKLDIKELYKLSTFTNDFIEFFKQKAVDRQQVIIAGSVLEEHEENYYNTTYIFDEQGKQYFHRKTHIFPSEADWQTTEGDQLDVFDVGPVNIGIANCYEMEVPEVSRILTLKGADIIFSPSFTFSEEGYWRVRHCAQARAIENQIYVIHCPLVGSPGQPVPVGHGQASILSPCDFEWNSKGIIATAEWGEHTVIHGELDMNKLYENRKHGSAPTYTDRTRRESLYKAYLPYK